MTPTDVAAAVPEPIGAVTRMEVVSVVASAFGAGSTTRSELVDAAQEAGARSEVIDLLGSLPDGRFKTPARSLGRPARRAPWLLKRHGTADGRPRFSSGSWTWSPGGRHK